MLKRSLSRSRSKSVMVSTAEKIANNFKFRKESHQNEHYPELSGNFLKFMEENYAGLVDADVDIMLKFEALTGKIIMQLPKGSSFAAILDTFGWNGSQFEFEDCRREIEVESLKKAIGALFFSHMKGAMMFDKYKDDNDAPPLPVTGLYENLFSDERIFGSFCPNLVFSLLTQMQKEKMQMKGSDYNDFELETPSSTSFEGACLLVDISGFTNLSGQFCDRGNSGLDALYSATSVYLGKFVQVVYMHKGDVIAFAGDALLCIFRAQDERQDEAPANYNEQYCRRATMCALALKDLHTEQLSAHVGVSCGTMAFANLGGHNNEWTFLLNGRCIHELSNCVDHAKAGEVVVTEDVFKKLNENLYPDDVVEFEKEGSENAAHIGVYKIQSLRGTVCPSLTFTSRFNELPENGAARSVKSFVPRSILVSVESGTLDTIAELREVCTLFLKLDSYDIEKNLDPLTLQPFLCMAQEKLAKSGGFLRQFLIDDKGCVLIAMWGVPFFTYINNSSRALTFAVEMQQGAATIGHECSIGITSGQVFCGNVGSLFRRDFVGIGATVNLAARLMSKAKGKIFVSEKAQQITSKAHKCYLTRHKVLLTLKGLSKPVEVWECDWQNSIELLSSPIEGRERSEYLQKSVSVVIINQINLSHNATLKYEAGPSSKVPVETVTKMPTMADVEPNLSDKFDVTLKMKPQWRNKEPLNTGCIAITSGDTGEIAMHHKSNSEQGYVVRTTVIRGGCGAGKKGAANLFRNFCKKCQYEVITVAVTVADQSVPYNVLRRLFVDLVGGPTSFISGQKMKSIFEELLERYPSEISMPDDVRLQHLMDIFKSVGDNGNVTAEKGAVNPAQKGFSRKVNSFKSKMTKEELTMKHDVMLELVEAMLPKKKLAICIEEAHLMDDYSWQALSDILTLHTSMPLMLTMFRKPQAAAADPMPFPVLSRMGKASRSTQHLISPMPSKELKSPAHGHAISPMPSKDLTTEINDNHISHAILKHRNTAVVDILPLEHEEVKMLLCHRLGVKELSAALVNAACAVSCGNAFWCNEIASFVDERGQDEFIRVSLKNEMGSSSPLGILIICRLQKLTVEEQSVLKYASIVGEEFSLTFLAASMPLKLIPNLNEMLITLVHHNFLVKDGEEDVDDNGELVPVYRFVNTLIHSIIYDLTPPTDTKRIHKHVAEQIEISHQEDLKPYYRSLSHHNGKSGIGGYPNACKFSVKAADLAIRFGVYTDGLTLCMEALKYCTCVDEFSMLLMVIDRGLQDMTQTTKVTRLLMSKKSSQQAQESNVRSMAYQHFRNIVLNKLALKKQEEEGKGESIHSLNNSGVEEGTETEVSISLVKKPTFSSLARSAIFTMAEREESYSATTSKLTWYPSYSMLKNGLIPKIEDASEHRIEANPEGATTDKACVIS